MAQHRCYAKAYLLARVCGQATPAQNVFLHTVLTRAALKVSWQRFVGTLLGAIVGGIAASYFGPKIAMFGITVLMLGILCAFTRSDQSAYRFGGITLVIVMLVPRTGPAWRIAFDRFAETSIGIGVALLLTVLWPDTEVPAGGKT